jgi:hypothetical protein
MLEQHRYYESLEAEEQLMQDDFFGDRAAAATAKAPAPACHGDHSGRFSAEENHGMSEASAEAAAPARHGEHSSRFTAEVNRDAPVAPAEAPANAATQDDVTKLRNMIEDMQYVHEQETRALKEQINEERTERTDLARDFGSLVHATGSAFDDIDNRLLDHDTAMIATEERLERGEQRMQMFGQVQVMTIQKASSLPQAIGVIAAGQRIRPTLASSSTTDAMGIACMRTMRT